jgi:hypothetical protein
VNKDTKKNFYTNEKKTTTGQGKDTFKNFFSKKLKKIKAKSANMYLSINDGLLDVGALLLVDDGALGLGLLDVLGAALGVGDVATVLCSDGGALFLSDGGALLLRHRVVPAHRV